MGRNLRKWADIPAGHDSPLNYAVTARDKSVIQMVDQALRQNRVMLAYQAVVLAADPSKVVFYEGLIRVLDPSGRVIPAEQFITQVEMAETGRLIDCAALHQGLRMLHKHPDLRLSLNMSARSFGYPKWNQTLTRGLKEDPTVAERLILEITEGSAFQVPELVVAHLNQLQKKGISFALDEFGAGYTSFRHLKQFYFDFLKINGEFIRGIASDPDNQTLTAALLGLARQLDMVCVAASVENAQDATYLQQLGMDCLQGYFFGAPTVRPPWDLSAQRRDTA